MRFKLLVSAFAAIGLLFAIQASAQTYAITNAGIVTVSGAKIDRGTVVVRNGLIEAVGPNGQAPADAQVFDGTGLTVYPGFIDTLTNLGLQAPARPTTGSPGGAAAAQQAQAAQSNSNFPAGLRPEERSFEDLRAGEAQFEAARNAGFTTAASVGRTGIFNGQSVVFNLAGDSTSAMVVKSPFALHVSFTTIGGGQYPVSLLGTFSAFRQMLLDARRLRELETQYAASPRGMKRPEADRSLEALFPVLDRQLPVVFNANREIEIVRALDLAKEFNLNAIIAGGQEAWKLAERLKAQNIPVLLSLNFPKRTAAAAPDADPETLDLLRFRAETPKGPGRLAQAGVKFAFQSGGATTLADVFANAQKAVDAGLNKDAAVRAMTLGAAEILGIADRLGSIETGKIANLTVVKGDIFAKDRYVSHVFVDGKLFEQKEPAKPTTPTPTAAAVPNVAGTYSINIDVPGQPLAGTLTMSQEGSVITGSMQTQLGVSPIQGGKVAAEGFSFTSTVLFGGATMDIAVRGTVTGNQISGTIQSAQGPVTFSGTKNP